MISSRVRKDMSRRLGRYSFFRVICQVETILQERGVRVCRGSCGRILQLRRFRSHSEDTDMKAFEGAYSGDQRFT